MPFSPSYFPYEQTNGFSRIATDYVASQPLLAPFYEHSVDIEGIKNAITKRKTFPTDRALLVEQLTQQYNSVVCHDLVNQHIGLLRDENTFTITTAHQPNIFTGHLYFIYKIIH